MKHVLSIISACICVSISSNVLAVDRDRSITVETPVVAATCTVGNSSIDFGTFGVHELGSTALTRTTSLPMLCNGDVVPTGLVFSGTVIGSHATGNILSSVSGMSYEVVKDTNQMGLADGSKINNTQNLLLGVDETDRQIGTIPINYAVRITPMADGDLDSITPTAVINDSINVTLTY